MLRIRGVFIPDPDSCPSRIPEPTTVTKEGGEIQGSGSGLDSDSIGPADPDPDPAGQKCPTKVEIFFKVHVLKCWMAELQASSVTGTYFMEA